MVQVGASAGEGRAQHPTWDPYLYWPALWLGLGYGGGWYSGWNMHWMMMDTPPRGVSAGRQVVLRDAQSQRIVYETSAQYDEVRVNDDTIWQVLFDAALTGFPAPPPGPARSPSCLRLRLQRPRRPGQRAAAGLAAGGHHPAASCATRARGAVPATAAPVNRSVPVRPASELGR